MQRRELSQSGKGGVPADSLVLHANEDQMAGSVVVEILHEYMSDRLSNLEESLFKVDTNDPYLIGYARGLETGFKMAVDLVGIADVRAGVGEALETDTEYRRKLGRVVSAINQDVERP